MLDTVTSSLFGLTPVGPESVPDFIETNGSETRDGLCPLLTPAHLRGLPTAVVGMPRRIAQLTMGYSPVKNKIGTACAFGRVRGPRLPGESMTSKV